MTNLASLNGLKSRSCSQPNFGRHDPFDSIPSDDHSRSRVDCEECCAVAKNKHLQKKKCCSKSSFKKFIQNAVVIHNNMDNHDGSLSRTFE